MIITDAQIGSLLIKVKESLAISYHSDDLTLKRHILSAIDIMQKSGINNDKILSDSGVQQVVVLASDFWRSGGEYKISKDAYFWLNTLNYSASLADEDL
jgi:hypothetical protein